MFWRRAGRFYLTSDPSRLLPPPEKDPAPSIPALCEPEPAWHSCSAAIIPSGISGTAASETARRINAVGLCSALGRGGTRMPRIWLDRNKAQLRPVLTAHGSGAAAPQGWNRPQATGRGSSAAPRYTREGVQHHLILKNGQNTSYAAVRDFSRLCKHA